MRAFVQRHAGEGMKKAFLSMTLNAEGTLVLMIDAMRAHRTRMRHAVSHCTRAAT